MKVNGRQEPPSFSAYQKFIILILALLQFTIVLDFMILSPLGDILMKSLSMSPAQFGSVVSAYAFSACFSGFFAAGFADKFDRKKLLLFFYAGFIIGTVFCGLANSYWTLFSARVLTGVFGGVVGSVSMAVITDLFSLDQRGKVMGFVQMAFAGSQILGIPIGLYLSNLWSWHSAFFMIVAIALVIALLIVFRMKPITAHLSLQNNRNALQHLWHTLKKRDYRTGFLATAFLSMGGFMLMPFTSAFLVNNVSIQQTELPWLFLATGVASMTVMPLIGKISDKHDKFKVFAVGSFIAMIMIVIYTNLSPIPLWQVAAINIILFMGIMSRMVPATALNSAVPDMADRGAYMSVNASLQQAAGGLASMFGGLVIVQRSSHRPLENFDVLGYIMVGMILLCLWFMYRVNKIVVKKRDFLNAPQKATQPL